jgi:glutaredoxin-like protein
MVKRASREGTQVPDVDLADMSEGKPRKLNSRELFGGKRVILFALPGAFTPTCSTAHVPGYVARLKDFAKAGIRDVICLSVNDPFVMEAWKASEKAEGIHFVADPMGEFTRAMGMEIEHREPPLGLRSWRYSMLVNDGKIEKMFIEPDVPGDPFEVSDADTMWKHLMPNGKTQSPAFMLARHGCPHCARAKQLLNERGIAFEAVHLGDELSMQGVKAAAGKATVPQVFMDGKLIGGADQLAEHLARTDRNASTQQDEPAVIARST